MISFVDLHQICRISAQNTNANSFALLNKVCLSQIQISKSNKYATDFLGITSTNLYPTRNKIKRKYTDSFLNPCEDFAA
jgi:hypothetical protein